MKLFLKNIGIFLLALLMLCSAASCAKETEGVEYVGNLAFYDLGNNTLAVGVAPECEKLITAETIPAEHAGNPVVRIVRSGFANCENLSSITLPDGLVEIGISAFSNCTSLTEVKFSEQCKPVSIGDYAFSGCSAMGAISIPDTVTDIGSYAFSFCVSLESAELPDALTVLKPHTFYQCETLKSISIPDTVTEVGKYAFLDCESVSEIRIGKGVSIIGQYAFKGCDMLERFEVDAKNGSYSAQSGILYAGDNFVAIPNQLKGDVVIPEGVKAIPSSTFAGQSEITSISIPTSVISIGGSAFAGCEALEKVTFADPNGWRYDDSSLGSKFFANPQNVAKYITGDFSTKAWKKSN